jgi:hypothetical protein
MQNEQNQTMESELEIYQSCIRDAVELHLAGREPVTRRIPIPYSRWVDIHSSLRHLTDRMIREIEHVHVSSDATRALDDLITTFPSEDEVNQRRELVEILWGYQDSILFAAQQAYILSNHDCNHQQALSVRSRTANRESAERELREVIQTPLTEANAEELRLRVRTILTDFLYSAPRPSQVRYEWSGGK